jgi:hypothetical protein
MFVKRIRLFLLYEIEQKTLLRLATEVEYRRVVYGRRNHRRRHTNLSAVTKSLNL